jgi:predicted GNAT family N-acyltransferase
MAQPVTAILSHQGELAAKARLFTQDTNEAGILVGKVVCRAMDAFQDGTSDDVILHAMQRDLDRMIQQMRGAQL